MPSFFIVEFRDGLQLVSSTWIEWETLTCSWPQAKCEKDLHKAVQQHQPVQKSWNSYKIKRIFGSASSFKKGLLKLKKAEFSSDISTEDGCESAKEVQLNKRIINFGESSDDEACVALQHFPIFPSEPQHSENKSVSSNCTEQRNSENDDRMENIEMETQQNVVRDDFQMQVKKQLTRLSLQLSLIAETQHLIIEKLTHANESQAAIDVAGDLDLAQHFPFSSSDELEKFDETLKINTNMQMHLLKDFSRRGGNSVKNIILNILNYLMKNSVANEYSWFGAKGKKKFSNLVLSKILKDAVRVHAKNATDVEIIQVVQSWLRHAKEKLKRAEKLNITV
ncbi:uncharacterized protein LOC118200498 [Stegodyphus dumicola]|uniref:uncharacterized protein LOC118200498 n=1 Tax=Stegodyphus dumicola TaxID=202533 RepID=UPI0015A7B2E3|nr:uncharacterized protein LOC118200498 [Stegodyphus dumicola]